MRIHPRTTYRDNWSNEAVHLDQNIINHLHFTSHSLQIFGKDTTKLAYSLKKLSVIVGDTQYGKI